MKKTLAKPPTSPSPKAADTRPRTLAIDIGGTGIKALTLDPVGKPINDRSRIPTPKHATPKDVVDIARKLAKDQPDFERVSVGFPGVVKDGVIYTAANLGHGWEGFDLGQALAGKLGKPVRVANDADIQGLGCATGNGLELVITLGTGFGSVLLADGTRVHLELGHHPFHKGKTYEDELGNRALKKKGRKKWNKLLQQAIDDLQRTFNYDRLYIGGGNSKLVTFKLPDNVKTISNEDGLLGGIALWRDLKPELPKRQKGAKVAPAAVKTIAKAVEKAPKAASSKPPAASSAKPAVVAPSKPSVAPPRKPNVTGTPSTLSRSSVSAPRSGAAPAKPPAVSSAKPAVTEPPKPAAPPPNGVNKSSDTPHS